MRGFLRISQVTDCTIDIGDSLLAFGSDNVLRRFPRCHNVLAVARSFVWFSISTLALLIAGCGGSSTGGTGSHDAGTGGSGAGGAGGAGGGSAGASGGAGGSAGASGGAGGSAGASGGAGGNSGSAGADAGPCTTHCSSDLHAVVDCNGNVVKTCPADQGCSGDTCVPACDSAKQNRSTYGCDYYSVTPAVLSGVGGGAGACFATFIVNTWTTPVSLNVEYDGQLYDASSFGYVPTGTGSSITYAPLPGGQVPAGQVGILFLDVVPGGFHPGLNFDCPAGVTPMIVGTDTAVHGTGIGKAFHLAASAPVTAYDIYPYGGGQGAITSATLLIPTTAWDTNYIAVDPAPSGLNGAVPFVAIVAQQDNTAIKINPTNNIVGINGVAAGDAGQATIYNIDKGQVLQFGQPQELAGSVIQSNVPVGVWGGHSGYSVEDCCNDSAHQQIPPIRALGSRYVAVRYRNRYDGTEESPPWRLIGVVDGTQLSYDPAPPAGAPTTLGRGEIAQFDAAGPFTVWSQDAAHPFYMSAHMTGGGLYDPDPNDPALGDGRGDAEFVNVVPPLQYLSKYVFFTDPTYPETNLVVVRPRGNGGFADVNLDCAGNLTGWAPVGNAGDYEYTRIDLSRHDFQGQNGCDNGRHVVSSKFPFGVTVWGWGSAETGIAPSGVYTQYVSYAYPAGAGVAPINSVTVSPSP